MEAVGEAVEKVVIKGLGALTARVNEVMSIGGLLKTSTRLLMLSSWRLFRSIRGDSLGLGCGGQ